jgi:protein associated with RNAse G/E
VLKETNEYIVVGSECASVLEGDGRFWRAKEPAITIFFKNKWFNVICMLRTAGIHYYCNISSPYVYDDEAIKYIDYDLDLRVDSKFNYRILDKDEYKYHAKIMEYSPKLKAVIEKSLENVIEMVKNKVGPFNLDVVMKYYNEYKKLNSKLKK